VRITEGIRILLACPSHKGCACAGAIVDAMPEDSDTAIEIEKAIAMISNAIRKDWDEAIALNEAFKKGQRAWMAEALAAPAPSESARDQRPVEFATPRRDPIGGIA
jgi:hypothetical protein